MTTELMAVPGTATGVLIDYDMSVVPTCGSCLEPLFGKYKWASVVRGANEMVASGKHSRDDTLSAVVDLLMTTCTEHPCPIREYTIYEEEEL